MTKLKVHSLIQESALFWRSFNTLLIDSLWVGLSSAIATTGALGLFWKTCLFLNLKEVDLPRLGGTFWTALIPSHIQVALPVTPSPSN